MNRAAAVLLVGFALLASARLYRAGAELGERQAEIDALRTELKAAQRATDVEYFARQCDREKREELARCGCARAEAAP